MKQAFQTLLEYLPGLHSSGPDEEHSIAVIRGQSAYPSMSPFSLEKRIAAIVGQVQIVCVWDDLILDSCHVFILMQRIHGTQYHL